MENNLFFTPIVVEPTVGELLKEVEKWKTLYTALKDEYQDFQDEHHKYRKLVEIEIAHLKSLVPKETKPGIAWRVVNSGSDFHVFKPFSLTTTEYTNMYRIVKAHNGSWNTEIGAFVFKNSESAKSFSLEAGKLIPNKKK